jgi:hypothetical protein
LSGSQNQQILRKFSGCNRYDLNRDRHQLNALAP